MKRLIFASALLAASACNMQNGSAMPNPGQVKPIPSAPLYSCLNETETKTLDILKTKKQMLVLHECGVRFLSPSGKEQKVKIDENMTAFASELVFNEKVLAGKLLSENESIVLFKNGKFSFMNFDQIRNLTFVLFEKPPIAPMKLFVKGKNAWFVLIGTREVVKVEWISQKDILVRRFTCDNISEIKPGYRFEYDEKTLRIYDGKQLLEEVKPKEKEKK